MDVLRVELRGKGRVGNFAAWCQQHGQAGYRIWVASDQASAVALRSRRR